MAPEIAEHNALKMGSIDIVYKVNEINLANLIIYSLLMERQKNLDLAGVRMTQILAKNAANKIASLRFLVKNFTFYSEIARLCNFLEAFAIYYGLILHTMLLRENSLHQKATEGYEKSEKPIATIYFENYLLASKVQELEKELAAAAAKGSDPLFVGVVIRFYEQFVRSRDLLKQWAYQGTQCL